MLLVRHGESVWNVSFGEVRIDSYVPDPVLTPVGIEQANRAADALASEGVTRLIASPYKRTLETATIISKKLGLDIYVEPLVRERCAFGCDQGSPKEELARLWPELEFGHLEPRWWGARIESIQSIEQRSKAFLQLAEQFSDRETTAVICHWGFVLAASGRSVGNAEIVKVPRLARLDG